MKPTNGMGDEVRSLLAMMAEEVDVSSPATAGAVRRARRTLTRTGAVALVLVAALGIGAFSGVRALGGFATGRVGHEPTVPPSSVRVALVTDVGGLKDPLSALAATGLTQAQTELGVKGQVFETVSAVEREPNLRDAASHGFNFVIGVRLGQVIDGIAADFPKTIFVALDDPDPLASHPRNTVRVTFRVEQAGYLVGYVAGLAVASVDRPQVVSSVGAAPGTQSDAYIAGFEAGAKAADPKVRTLRGYAGTSTDPAACRAVARDQLDRGSQAVFAAAGACGVGAIEAVGERNRWAIGSDTDQHDLGLRQLNEFVLTSAMKRVDVAVFSAIQALLAGDLPVGGVVTEDLGSGGVGLGQFSSEFGTVTCNCETQTNGVDDVNRVKAEIISGKITVPDSPS